MEKSHLNKIFIGVIKTLPFIVSLRIHVVILQL